jgi:hypothetical protein
LGLSLIASLCGELTIDERTVGTRVRMRSGLGVTWRDRQAARLTSEAG